MNLRFAALLFILLLLAREVNAQTAWFPRPTGVLTQFTGVAFGGGVFLAIGSGTACRSTDSTTWSNSPVPAANTLAYGNGTFVGVSYYGKIWTSTDGGLSSTVRVSNGGLAFTDIAYGNGVWVAVGNNGLIERSLDGGVTWTLSLSPTASGLVTVIYGNGVFMAVGNGIVAISADGNLWTLQQTNFNGIGALAYGNGFFVGVNAAGVINRSPDNGATWTGQTITGAPFENVTFANGLFVAVGDSGTIYTSSDAQTWKKQTSGTAIRRFDVVYGNGNWVTVGDNGSVVTSAASSVQPLIVPNVQTSQAVILTWPSQSGAIYQVQTSSDSTNWLDTGIPIGGDGQQKTFADPTGASSKKFYRIQIH